MPRINLRTRNQPSIGELRELVVVCTTVERPDDWVSSLLTRPGVFRCHARVRDLRPDTILDYKAVLGSEDVPTKEVMIRCPPDVKVDLNHWIYREAGPSCGNAKEWLKIRSVEDLGEVGRFLSLRCSVDVVLDARTDEATQELPPVWETPSMD